MPKGKKSSDSLDLPRVAVHALITVTVVSAIVIVFRLSMLYVDRELAAPTRPPRMVLVNRPAWMSDILAEQIVNYAQPAGLHSSFNRQLLADTGNKLAGDPWIRHVNQVRRVYYQNPGDTIEIDCDYRVPAALVKWGNFHWLVDGQGTRLPEQYTADQLPRIMFGEDGKVNVREIDGVTHAPCEPGKTWAGDDLAGGLELAKLLDGQSWAEEIRKIDVSNMNGRRDAREAQIVLITEYGTQVRWGRPPSASDGFVEVPTATKLAALQAIYDQKKRIDANQAWIDVRFDHVTCPAPAPPSASAN
jgi:hypothetical protein